MSQAQYTDQIVRLIEEQGRNQAAAAERTGQIWGGALANLGQIPAQVQQQQREKQQQDLRNQELALRTQQVGLEVGKAQRQASDTGVLDQLWSDPTIYNTDGSINRNGIQKKLQAAGAGHLGPSVMETVDHLDESRSSVQAKQQALREAQRETLGKDALRLEAANNDPNLFRMIVTDRARPDAQIIPADQATEYLKGVQTPEQVAAIAKQWKAGTKSGESDLMIVPEGATPLDKRTNQPLAGFTPTEKPKDEFNTFKSTYAQAQGKTKWEQLSPPQQAAGFKAYVEAKADPAAQRQAASIHEQTIVQGNIADRQAKAEKTRQDFETLKTARADIQKNADTPLQSALSAADELRGLVSAAKSGNKIAASEQNLATAAATIRGFGLNRINMAEIGMPATAGSAADKVANFIGKWTEGQQVNPDLQKDMLQVADTLEAAARKKYKATHAGINKLYGTTIPQTFDDAATPSSTAPAAGNGGTPGLTYADYLKKKGG